MVQICYFYGDTAFESQLTLQQLLVYDQDLENTEFRTDFDGTKTNNDVNRIQKRFVAKSFNKEKRGDKLMTNENFEKNKCCGGSFQMALRLEKAQKLDILKEVEANSNKTTQFIHVPLLLFHLF